MTDLSLRRKRAADGAELHEISRRRQDLFDDLRRAAQAMHDANMGADEALSVIAEVAGYFTTEQTRKLVIARLFQEDRNLRLLEERAYQRVLAEQRERDQHPDEWRFPDDLRDRREPVEQQPRAQVVQLFPAPDSIH